MLGRKGDLLARGDIAAALGLLTRLPVRVDAARATARGAGAAWAWPLAGLAVALPAGAAAALALWAGLPATLAAGLAIAVQIIVTGALHEDGLADSCDGFWGAWERARRLEIMKDSRIGTFGVLALVLSLGLRWQALTLLIAAGWLWPALLLTGLLSRVPMVALAWALPPARAGGLSRGVGRPGGRTFALAAALAGLAALALAGTSALPAALAVAAVTLLWGLIARARIGGQTGDVLGAGQQLAELACLLALASRL